MGSILALTSKTTYDKPIGHRQREHAIRGQSLLETTAKAVKDSLKDTKEAITPGDTTSRFVGAKEFIPNSGSLQGVAAEERKRVIRYGGGLTPERRGPPGPPGTGSPSDTVVLETTDGQNSSAGVVDDLSYSRGSHTHGTPPRYLRDYVVPEKEWNLDPMAGSLSSVSRGDHTHGTPPNPNWGTLVPDGLYFAGEGSGPPDSTLSFKNHIIASQVLFGEGTYYESISVLVTPGRDPALVWLGLYEDAGGLPGRSLETARCGIDPYGSGDPHLVTLTFPAPMLLKNRYWVSLYVSMSAEYEELTSFMCFASPSIFSGHIWRAGDIAPWFLETMVPIYSVIKEYTEAEMPDFWGEPDWDLFFNPPAIIAYPIPKLGIFFKRI